MRKRTLLFHIQEIYHLKKEIGAMLKPCGGLELLKVGFGAAAEVCKVN